MNEDDTVRATPGDNGGRQRLLPTLSRTWYRIPDGLLPVPADTLRADDRLFAVTAVAVARPSPNRLWLWSARWRKHGLRHLPARGPEDLFLAIGAMPGR